MHIILIICMTLVSHHYSYNSAQSYASYDHTSSFPFRLGEHQFNEPIDRLYRETLRKNGSTSIASINLLLENKHLLSIAQQLYCATQKDKDVKKYFAKAVEKTLENREALWEWQDACKNINRVLHQKVKELKQTPAELSKSDLQKIYALSHFAFQQNKYIVEKHICEQNQREHTHRWFIRHDYKGRL